MERDFQLSHGELKIPCKLSVPDYGEVQRVVLGVHGLGGCTEDAIQVSIAEEMELFSSAVIRFDFPAHGQSPLDSRYFTLKNCVDTLLTVAGFARERFPSVEDLCIFATGFGAYVTLVSLNRLVAMPGKVKLVVQTPSVRMDETLLTMARVTEPTLRAMEKVTINARPRPFDVTYSLYEELRENVVLMEYPIPMLILHGEEDSYIRMEDIRHFHSLNDSSELVIIPGASHRFLEAGAWDMVLDLTRDWFAFEQVLLGV